MSPLTCATFFIILCGSPVVGVRDFPGIAIEVTNAALRFLSSVVKQAIPKVLHDIQLVDQTGLGWQAFNLMVKFLRKYAVCRRFETNVVL